MRFSTLTMIRNLLAERELEARIQRDAAAEAFKNAGLADMEDEEKFQRLQFMAESTDESWRDIHAALEDFDAVLWIG